MVESLSQLTSVEYQVDKLIRGDKETIHENANKDSSMFSTRRDLIAGQVSKAKGLQMYPIEVQEAHQGGLIHLHDLDYQPFTSYTNCCLIDMKFLFDNGFNMGGAEIDKPKSIQTAVAQMVQVIANVASSQLGGCSIQSIDILLAEYAEMNYKKHLDKAEVYKIPDVENYALQETKKDIYDAMQSIEYECNTLFTSNGQSPFITIGFGLGESWFEREIQKAMLKVRINGLGKSKKTAIFPKQIFAIKDGLNRKEGDPNYDIKQLALECSSKRMYPDILNYDKIIELTGSFKFPMGK